MRPKNVFICGSLGTISHLPSQQHIKLALLELFIPCQEKNGTPLTGTRILYFRKYEDRVKKD